MPQSNKTGPIIHYSDQEITNSQTSQDPLLSSLVPFVPHNNEQTTLIKSEKSDDIQQRILDLLLGVSDKGDKMVSLQETILSLQSEARAKDDKMAAMQRDMLELQLEAKEQHDRMIQMQQQALDRLAVIQEKAEAILTQTYELHEYPIPRLFIILPKEASKWDPSRAISDKFRLYFLCECGAHTKAFNDDNTNNISHHIHLAKHEGYDIRRPNEFFQQYGKYMLTLLEMIKYGVKIAGFAVPALSSIDTPTLIDNVKNTLKTMSQSDVDQSIEYLQGLVDDDSNGQGSDNGVDANTITGQDALEGADLRHLETFIKSEDKDRVLGNLYRIVTQEGHVKWVCIDHYRLNYREKDELAFKTAVALNGGTYKPQLGQVLVDLGSKIRASEFFDALTKARTVIDLDITFHGQCGRNELEVLEKALKTSRVSVLQLDLRLLLPGIGSRLLSTSQRYDALFRIMNLPNMRTIHIILPRDFVKLSILQSKKPSHLRKLSFAINPESVGQQEARWLAETLKTGLNLTDLSLMTRYIGDDVVQVLSEALKTNSTLSILNLGDNSIGADGAQALSEALKVNSTLTNLYLDSNWIGDNGVRALSEALKINSTLTSLGLRGNSIGDNGALALSEVLKINSTLMGLGLDNNSVGDKGTQALSEALKMNSTLTALYLGNNSMGDNGAQALSEMLKINSTLTTLRLVDNSIGYEGAQALSEGIKINSTLTTLNLAKNSIGDKGAQALSEGLKINSTLTGLDLGDNAIGDNGAQALLEALKINSSLTIMDLKNNSTEDNGAQALSEVLKINSTLTTLNFHNNSIGDSGAQALSEGLTINSTLTALDLGNNSIGDSGALALSEGLKINLTLTILDLRKNSIGGEGAQALSEALKMSSTLSYLKW